MRSEEVQGQEEGPVAVVRVGGVVLQPLDGAGGQVVLEGGLDRLVQTGGEQVPGAAVREVPRTRSLISYGGRPRSSR